MVRTYVGSGPDSANLVKQLRSDRTSGNKLQFLPKNQEQATSEAC